MLVLHCRTGFSLIVVLRLLIAVACLVVEQTLGHTGFSACSSWTLEHRLNSCGARAYLHQGLGWDGWMASLTRWTWVWVNSGSWWGTGRPGVLWFMGSQRVRYNWATDLIWCDMESLSRVRTWISCIDRWILYHWATREASIQLHIKWWFSTREGFAFSLSLLGNIWQWLETVFVVIAGSGAGEL